MDNGNIAVMIMNIYIQSFNLSHGDGLDSLRRLTNASSQFNDADTGYDLVLRLSRVALCSVRFGCPAESNELVL